MGTGPGRDKLKTIKLVFADSTLAAVLNSKSKGWLSRNVYNVSE